MDVELSWQTFACTGDILCYLDYRRQLAQQRLTAPAGEKTDGAIEEQMLVLHQFTERRLDQLLFQLRKAGVPKIELKAIVTEQNSRWTLYQLYEELRKEREAFADET